MNTMSILKDKISEAFKNKSSNQTNGVDSLLVSKQKEAFLNFEKIGFPTTKNEEWKYTNLASMLEEDFNTSSSVALTKKDIESFLYPLEANALVLINGIYSKELSTILSPTS